MSGKVIHVTDALHAKVKTYCEGRDLQMTSWVAYALEQAIEQCIVPVPKKPLEDYQAAVVTEEDLLKNPPFWAGRRS